MRKIITVFLFIIWLTNGLVCKVLNLVPRHQQIVAEILGDQYARPFTFLIGISEIIMAAWILSGIHRRVNAITQISVILLMNIIEFFAVPELLLFGHVNLIVALGLVCVIYYWEFVLNKKSSHAIIS